MQSASSSGVTTTTGLSDVVSRRGRPDTTPHDSAPSRWRSRAVAIGATVVALVLWESASRVGLLNPLVVPAPSAIAIEIATDRELFAANGAASGLTAALGFVAGHSIAVVLATALSLSTVAELVVTKLALVVYSLPTLAIAPILGTMFGLDGTRIAVVAIVVFFPTMLATVSGFKAVGRDTASLVRSLGGSRLTIIAKVGFRTALPEIFSGLKLGVPGAVLGAIASEWLGASQGLGIFMVNSLAYLQPTRVWGTCVVIVCGTILAYGLVAVIDKRVNNWSVDAREDAR